jgi:hypothetical protein
MPLLIIGFFRSSTRSVKHVGAVEVCCWDVGLPKNRGNAMTDNFMPEVGINQF